MKDEILPVKNHEELIVEENQQASDENALQGEEPIERYDDINPEHKAFEDIDEVQRTDDV